MIRRYQTAGVSPKDQERRRKDGNPRRPKPPNLRVADPWANWIAIYIECARAERTRAQRFRQSQHWLSRALPSPWSPPPHESKVQVRYAAEEPSSAHIVPVIPYTRLIMDRVNEPRDARTCDFLRLDATARTDRIVISSPPPFRLAVIRLASVSQLACPRCSRWLSRVFARGEDGKTRGDKNYAERQLRAHCTSIASYREKPLGRAFTEVGKMNNAKADKSRCASAWESRGGGVRIQAGVAISPRCKYSKREIASLTCYWNIASDSLRGSVARHTRAHIIGETIINNAPNPPIDYHKSRNRINCEICSSLLYAHSRVHAATRARARR